MEDIISSTIGAFQAVNATHRTPIRPLASLMKTPALWVAIISAWRQSVFLCCKLMDLFSTHLEFPIHSLWSAAEVLSQPLCKSAILAVHQSTYLLLIYAKIDVFLYSSMRGLVFCLEVWV